jgi:hypothetical protein
MSDFTPPGGEPPRPEPRPDPWQGAGYSSYGCSARSTGQHLSVEPAILHATLRGHGQLALLPPESAAVQVTRGGTMRVRPSQAPCSESGRKR